jgi:hypothetical protein
MSEVILTRIASEFYESSRFFFGGIFGSITEGAEVSPSRVLFSLMIRRLPDKCGTPTKPAK